MRSFVFFCLSLVLAVAPAAGREDGHGMQSLSLADLAEGALRLDGLGSYHRKDAVQREDRLNYDEPSNWFHPARHHLGAALLAAGRPADAEAVFRADLERNPANGWALFSLQQALAAQKKDAGAVKADLEKAWSRADVKLVGSVF